jgi:agmatinase
MKKIALQDLILVLNGKTKVLFICLNEQFLLLRHKCTIMNSKQKKINKFNPNDLASVENNIFGLPFSEEESEVIVLPLPWEVTVSFSDGTSRGPDAVYEASKQVDLYDPFVKDAWKGGIFMRETNTDWQSKSDDLRAVAEEIIDMLSAEEKYRNESWLAEQYSIINRECNWFRNQVKEEAATILKSGKIIAGLGGDHSTPLGILEALAEQYSNFAILQLDAHLDLRKAYEGFDYSHASIMFNAMKIPAISKIVQVGIRDYCEEELNLIHQHPDKLKVYFDRDIKQQQYAGASFSAICDDIIAQLPELVYLSFDIDALDPKLCPNTGTPVAGGFETEQVLFLLEKLVKAGKKIISFDINEVGNHEWDANVAARLLYRISNLTSLSMGKL